MAPFSSAERHDRTGKVALLMVNGAGIHDRRTVQIGRMDTRAFVDTDADPSIEIVARPRLSPSGVTRPSSQVVICATFVAVFIGGIFTPGR